MPIEWRAPSELMSFVADELTHEILVEALGDWPNSALELGDIEAAISRFATRAFAALPHRRSHRHSGAARRYRTARDVCAPATDLIAIGELNDIQFYRAMRAAGVADYLVKPVNAAPSWRPSGAAAGQ